MSLRSDHVNFAAHDDFETRERKIRADIRIAAGLRLTREAILDMGDPIKAARFVGDYERKLAELLVAIPEGFVMRPGAYVTYYSLEEVDRLYEQVFAAQAADRSAPA